MICKVGFGGQGGEGGRGGGGGRGSVVVVGTIDCPSNSYQNMKQFSESIL